MLKRRDLVGAGGTLLALSALGGAAKAETPSEAIEIELRRDIGKLDHIWKRCVGSDRAEITMRESWRKDARRGRQELGLERVRFHAASSTTNWGSGSSAATTRRGSSARPTNTVRTVIAAAMAQVRGQINASRYKGAELWLSEWSSDSPAMIAHVATGCLPYCHAMSQWQLSGADRRLQASGPALATRRTGGGAAVMVWNLAEVALELPPEGVALIELA